MLPKMTAMKIAKAAITAHRIALFGLASSSELPELLSTSSEEDSSVEVARGVLVTFEVGVTLGDGVIVEVGVCCGVGVSGAGV
ncbi:MAG: hypothetical protein HOF10_11360, partial [Chloroflexi bacterium]|nr:hypothetical protein [Chloroflexota bacterium]